MGFGLGLFTSPNNSSVLGSVPRPRLGSASATVAQMRITGQVLGVAVGAAILASRIPYYTKELIKRLPPHLVRRDALILSIHDAFYVAAAICVLGALASMIRGRSSREDVVSGPQAGHTVGCAKHPSIRVVAPEYVDHWIKSSCDDR